MIARLLLALVFVSAGVLKLPDSLGVADGMAAFRLLPLWSIAPLALGIPVFEIVVGVSLLSKRFLRPAALAATGLSLAFVVLYALALARGLDVRCSCFGALEFFRVSTGTGLVRALVLLGLSARVYWQVSRRGA